MSTIFRIFGIFDILFASVAIWWKCIRHLRLKLDAYLRWITHWGRAGSSSRKFTLLQWLRRELPILMELKPRDFQHPIRMLYFWVAQLRYAKICLWHRLHLVCLDLVHFVDIVMPFSLSLGEKIQRVWFWLVSLNIQFQCY